MNGTAHLKVELWEGGGYVTIFLPRGLVEELIENGLVEEVSAPDGELYLLAEEIALAVGFPDPYADLDQKRRGEALNYDLYVVMGNWYVIQKRTYWKSSAKRPPRVKKEYYAACVCMGRVELISEVHHSTVHAMVRKLHG